MLDNDCVTFFCRFSSGDLSSECDDVDPNADPSAVPGTSKPPPLQSQPMPGGPPNIPPPPGNNKWTNLISKHHINFNSYDIKPYLCYH